MSTIGIIMATYNGEKYLREQIESILSNTYTDWSLSIYDDGSTDHTFSVIEEYVNKYPDKIKGFKNEKNLGVKHNFLNALKNTTERYVMFCDQDDVWLPEKIRMTFQKMLEVEKKQGTTPAVVFTDAKLVDEKCSTLSESFIKTTNLDKEKLDLAHILMENKLIGCTVMVNRPLIDKLIIPKTLRMHDWWVAIIASCFGNIAYVDEATILYRQHSNNVVGGQGKLAYFTNRISSLKHQKVMLRATWEQAEQFYDLYKEELSDRNKELVLKFAGISKENWINRRIILLRYGFLKTGFIRNIGVLLII